MFLELITATILMKKKQKKGDYISLVFMYYKKNSVPFKGLRKATRDRDTIDVQKFKGKSTNKKIQE